MATNKSARKKIEPAGLKGLPVENQQSGPSAGVLPLEGEGEKRKRELKYGQPDAIGRVHKKRLKKKTKTGGTGALGKNRRRHYWTRAWSNPEACRAVSKYLVGADGRADSRRPFIEPGDKGPSNVRVICVDRSALKRGTGVQRGRGIWVSRGKDPVTEGETVLALQVSQVKQGGGAIAHVLYDLHGTVVGLNTQRIEGGGT